MEMSKQARLDQAKAHCFFIGLNDSGAELCRANSIYSIATIHYLQEKLGIRKNASFITTPDMTITRNSARWKSGFGYGGKISWGTGEEEFIILNSKPNACGMLVGGLNQLPDAEVLLRKLHKLESEETKIDGIQVQWDFYKSNHFIDLFWVKQIARYDSELPPYAFIIHGSAGEFNGDNQNGFGLYFDKSPLLDAMAETLKTPFGPYSYLTGENARKYLTRYQEADSFAKKKREMAARILFDDFTLISNETHQGLLNMNELILGCNYLKDQNTLYPITLRADLPAYLVKGNPSLTPECIELLGFEKRARKLGLYDRLLHADIFPHGGGYLLPDTLCVNRVIEIDDNRYFEVEMLNDRGKKIISEIKDIPYDYRGRNVVLRALEIGLIEIIAKLIPQYVLKI